MESSQNAGKKMTMPKQHLPENRSLQDMAWNAVLKSYRFCYYTGVQLIRYFRRYKKRLFRFAVSTRLGIQLKIKKRLTLVGRKFLFAMNDAMRPQRKKPDMAREPAACVQNTWHGFYLCCAGGQLYYISQSHSPKYQSSVCAGGGV